MSATPKLLLNAINEVKRQVTDQKKANKTVMSL